MAAPRSPRDVSQTRHNQLPKLPACRFCHSRKAKCDNTRPKCSLCTKHGEECMTLEVEDSQPVSRDYIGGLEEEIKTLEGEIERSGVINLPCTPEPEIGQSPVTEEPDSETPQRDTFSARRERHSSNFVEGGGISFMRHLFADSGWREHDPTLLQNLSQGSGPAGAGVKPNALPSAQEARDIFDRYVNGSHVQRPFFLRGDVEKLYAKVFSVHQTSSARAESDKSHDLFRTFMILAIGSVLSYRNGVTPHHPYGYYVSAMKNLDESFLARGLESIQDLLFIGRFAIYYHIGSSIWEITRLCMRMCIEQNLHRLPFPASQTSLLHEQLQRRVFWECYMIDRYSSITLDRPVAIPDKSIQVGFPADADDEEIEAAERSGSFPDLDSYCAISALASASEPRNTEMSIFLTCLRLRQITSRIHSEFGDKMVQSHAGRSITARGSIYSKLERLLDQLQQWRCSSPVFNDPRCLYEMQEWHHLLYLRERLLLIRKAIDLVPKRNSSPPRDLLSLCLHSAVDAITIFCRLFKDKKITFTRSYFQMLFTAGLSVMYCLSVVRDFDFETVVTGTQSVTICEDALQHMMKELPDAKRYVAVFEALRTYIIRKYVSAVNYHSQSEPLLRTAESILNLQQTEISNLSTSHNPQPSLSTAGLNSLLHPTNPSNDSQYLQNEFDIMSIPHTDAQMHPDAPVSEGSILSFDIFGDDALWNMEAGLSEYACGDPPANLYFENPFELQYNI